MKETVINFLKIGYSFIADFGKNGNPANSKFKVVLTTVRTTIAKQQIARHLAALLARHDPAVPSIGQLLV